MCSLVEERVFRDIYQRLKVRERVCVRERERERERD